MTAREQNPGTAPKRKLVKRSDFLIIVALLLLALGLNFLYQNLFNKADLVADIYYQNEILESIPLRKHQARVFYYEQDPNVIFELYDDGSIAFKSSDCPDQVCVHSGKLHSEHAFAACLPNEFLMVLRSPETSASVPDASQEVDIVN